MERDDDTPHKIPDHLVSDEGRPEAAVVWIVLAAPIGLALLLWLIFG